MSEANGNEVNAELAAAATAGDPVALCRVLVGVPSVNPALEAGGTGEARIGAVCAEWLRGWGFETEVIEVTPGRPNVVARHEGAGRGPTLLLNGHLDTVGVGGMTVPPFGDHEPGERLVGRGCCDMKGGLAGLLAAGRALAADGHAGELVVALTCDEEHASLGMAALVEGGLKADAAIVCEPTDLAVMPAHKGFVWVEAEFRGRAAHGSRPDEGIDAIRHAARFLVGLSGLDEELAAGAPHALLGHGSVHAGTIEGGSSASVYPERCAVTLERRTLPGEGAEDVLEELGRVLAEASAEEPSLEAALSEVLTRPGTEVPEEHALVQGLLAACTDEGVPSRIEGMTAWVDAAYLNDVGIPAVCFGPGSIAQAHSADEWIEVGQIEAAARVLTGFARGFLGSAS